MMIFSFNLEEAIRNPPPLIADTDVKANSLINSSNERDLAVCVLKLQKEEIVSELDSVHRSPLYQWKGRPSIQSFMYTIASLNEAKKKQSQLMGTATPSQQQVLSKTTTEVATHPNIPNVTPQQTEFTGQRMPKGAVMMNDRTGSTPKQQKPKTRKVMKGGFLVSMPVNVRSPSEARALTPVFNGANTSTFNDDGGNILDDILARSGERGKRSKFENKGSLHGKMKINAEKEDLLCGNRESYKSTNSSCSSLTMKDTKNGQNINSLSVPEIKQTTTVKKQSSLQLNDGILYVNQSSEKVKSKINGQCGEKESANVRANNDKSTEINSHTLPIVQDIGENDCKLARISGLLTPDRLSKPQGKAVDDKRNASTICSPGRRQVPSIAKNVMAERIRNKYSNASKFGLTNDGKNSTSNIKAQVTLPEDSKNANCSRASTCDKGTTKDIQKRVGSAALNSLQLNYGDICDSSDGGSQNEYYPSLDSRDEDRRRSKKPASPTGEEVNEIISERDQGIIHNDDVRSKSEAFRRQCGVRPDSVEQADKKHVVVVKQGDPSSVSSNIRSDHDPGEVKHVRNELTFIEITDSDKDVANAVLFKNVPSLYAGNAMLSDDVVLDLVQKHHGARAIKTVVKSDEKLKQNDILEVKSEKDVHSIRISSDKEINPDATSKDKEINATKISKDTKIYPSVILRDKAIHSSEILEDKEIGPDAFSEDKEKRFAVISNDKETSLTEISEDETKFDDQPNSRAVENLNVADVESPVGDLVIDMESDDEPSSASRRRLRKRPRCLSLSSESSSEENNTLSFDFIQNHGKKFRNGKFNHEKGFEVENGNENIAGKMQSTTSKIPVENILELKNMEEEPLQDDAETFRKDSFGICSWNETHVGEHKKNTKSRKRKKKRQKSDRKSKTYKGRITRSRSSHERGSSDSLRFNHQRSKALIDKRQDRSGTHSRNGRGNTSFRRQREFAQSTSNCKKSLRDCERNNSRRENHSVLNQSFPGRYHHKHNREDRMGSTVRTRSKSLCEEIYERRPGEETSRKAKCSEGQQDEAVVIMKDETRSLLSMVDGTLDVTVAQKELSEKQKKSRSREKKKKKKTTSELLIKRKKQDRTQQHQHQYQQQKSQQIQQEPASCTFYKEGKCARTRKIKELCPYHSTRVCMKNEDGMCPRMHEEFPCMFHHQSKFCANGNNCRFSHAPLTKETREILDQYISNMKERQKAASNPAPMPAFSQSQYYTPIPLGKPPGPPALPNHMMDNMRTVQSELSQRSLPVAIPSPALPPGLPETPDVKECFIPRMFMER